MFIQSETISAGEGERLGHSIACKIQRPGFYIAKFYPQQEQNVLVQEQWRTSVRVLALTCAEVLWLTRDGRVDDWIISSLISSS